MCACVVRILTLARCQRHFVYDFAICACAYRSHRQASGREDGADTADAAAVADTAAIVELTSHKQSIFNKEIRPVRECEAEMAFEVCVCVCVHAIADRRRRRCCRESVIEL